MQDKFKQLIFTPEIHFGYRFLEEVHQYQITLPELYEWLESLRISAKSTGYNWDNSNFFIDNIFGQPVIKFILVETGDNRYNFSFWDVNENSLFCMYGIPEAKEMKIAIEKLTLGFKLCNNCKEWVKDGHKYSFAGFVCEKCYNPKTHQPPDTRGD